MEFDLVFGTETILLESIWKILWYRSMNSMRILLGTTNPSKVKRFSDLLKGYDVEFVTLKDLAIQMNLKKMEQHRKKMRLQKQSFMDSILRL